MRVLVLLGCATYAEKQDTAGCDATWYADVDGDGYGYATTALVSCDAPSDFVADATDCDDADATRFPGAEESCDDVDDDCDGTVDDGLDTATWYADADGDGYGYADDAVVACEAPAGFVEDATDCDDRSAAVYPGAPELCDGLDNDCVVDPGLEHAVPAMYADVQSAIDVAQDGDVVCVSAGTWGSIDFGGRDITVEGFDGAASTILDGGGVGPVVTLANGETAVLAGFTVTGGDAAEGAGIYAYYSSPTLRDLVVSGNTCAESECYGTGVYLYEADATLERVEISGNEQAPAGSDDVRASGAGLYATWGTVTMDSVHVHDNRQAPVGPEINRADGAGVYLYYAAFAAANDLVVEDNVQDLSYGTGAYAGGAGVALACFAEIDWFGGSVAGNSISGPAASYARGAGLYSSYWSWVRVQAVVIADNHADAASAWGGGANANGGRFDLQSVVVVGNSADGSTQAGGGGLAVQSNASEAGDAVLTNVDVYGNRVEAPTATGAGVYSGWGCGLILVNASIGGNSGTSVEGGGVYVWNYYDATEITFTNIHGNTTPEVSGIDDPTGTDGNIAVDPGYTDVTGSDPTAWDLTLAAGSALIDAGDTGALDPDGSRSDIGAYGGAAAAYW